MRNLTRLVAAACVAVGLAWASAALTRVPVDLHAPDEAGLRLSWRLPEAVARECRPPTEEERRRMPAHMTRDEICEERIFPYLLTVRLDGRPWVEEEVRPRGLRGDRPLSVFHESGLPPGQYRVQVRFAPSSGSPGAGELPVLEMDTVLALGSREVGLVTWDRDQGRLLARTPGPRSGPESPPTEPRDDGS